MPAPQEIETRARRLLVAALGLNEGDIALSATLQGDPGAEFIDFQHIFSAWSVGSESRFRAATCSPRHKARSCRP
jgi:hypothetical protein